MRFLPGLFLLTSTYFSPGPGFKNERIQYLNADHKTMVKFPHPNDDNYLKLKNALSGAVYDLLKDGRALYDVPPLFSS